MGLFRSRWDDRCGVDRPGSGIAPGWLGPGRNGFSRVLDGSALAVLRTAGMSGRGFICAIWGLLFGAGYKQNNLLLETG